MEKCGGVSTLYICISAIEWSCARLRNDKFGDGIRVMSL